MPNPPNLILGVDAGGTKTLALLAQAGPQDGAGRLGVGRAGPGNPLSSGFENAQQEIASAIRQAVENSGLPQPTIDRAVLSVAGAANPDVRARMTQWAAAAGFAAQAQIVPDFAPILAAAQSTGACAGVIAGTGSVSFCRDEAGQMHRSGGWGYLLGDEGSGYAIGRRALQAALEEIESQGSETPLANQLADALGLKGPTQLLPTIYQSDDPRSLIASLASQVIQAADSDEVARAMVRQEMTALANVIARGWKAAGVKNQSLPLSLAGGVLANSALTQSMLLTELKKQNCQVERTAVVQEPAEGCLLMARELSDSLESTL